jgi:hypothetical protein
MNPMILNLAADGTKLPDDTDLYGRLIGSWDVDNRQYDESAGTWHQIRLEWHFGRIIAGRGVQDVLRSSSGGVGTTVRVYDGQADLWRIGWYGATSGEFATLTGRAQGADILQDGVGTDGRPIRWNFSEITTNRFRWQGHVSDDDGRSWRLEQQMSARRRP